MTLRTHTSRFQTYNSQANLRRFCEKNLRSHTRRFLAIKSQSNLKKICEEALREEIQQRKICEIVLLEHTRSLPQHSSQDKIFWVNIWPLDILREETASTYSQISKRSRGFDLSTAQEEARPCQPISSLVFTSLLIFKISKGKSIKVHFTFHFSLILNCLLSIL